MSTDTFVTPQALLRAWISEWAMDRPSFTNEEIRAAALIRFADDEDFLQALFENALPQMVTDAARQVFAKDRRHIVTASGVVSRASIAERAISTDGWLRWNGGREFAGALHVRLPDMTKPQLLEAATARRARASGELLQAAFLEAVAARMPDDGSRVRDHFNPTQLDNLMEATR